MRAVATGVASDLKPTPKDMNSKAPQIAEHVRHFADVAAEGDAQPSSSGLSVPLVEGALLLGAKLNRLRAIQVSEQEHLVLTQKQKLLDPSAVRERQLLVVRTEQLLGALDWRVALV